MVAVHINGLQRPAPALDGDAVGCCADVCTHAAGGFDKADVALNGRFAHALHGDAVAKACIGGNSAQRNEVAG